LVAHRRARITAVALIRFCRKQGDGLVLPVQQIGGADVPPPLVAVRAAQRVPLVKKVIPAAVLDKAVGVIEQPHRGCQMPAGPMGIRRRLELAGQQRPDYLLEKIDFLHHSTLYLSSQEAAKAAPKAMTRPMTSWIRFMGWTMAMPGIPVRPTAVIPTLAATT